MTNSVDRDDCKEAYEEVIGRDSEGDYNRSHSTSCGEMRDCDEVEESPYDFVDFPRAIRVGVVSSLLSGEKVKLKDDNHLIAQQSFAVGLILFASVVFILGATATHFVKLFN